MKKKVRHLLGISGGKDSAALAIYMRNNYPDLDIEYYTSDTGKELDETYRLIEDLEIYLGKKIIRLSAASNSHETPFDHFLKMYGGFLPSSQARWCTNKLKLEPFERFVGDDLVISYVGIRGDENREGYISKKSNIQSIFPFRRNIWSEDVTMKAFGNQNISLLEEIFMSLNLENIEEQLIEIVRKPVSPRYTLDTKVSQLLESSIKGTNELIYGYLKTTDYPLAGDTSFPLLNNEDNLDRENIFQILEDSGIGIPKYYKELEFNTATKNGKYARSRSGCFFCFYQQKIEWVWLLEQHPELYGQAMQYEKDGYTWMQDESLEQLREPERVEKIKQDYLKKLERSREKTGSSLLVDILAESEGEGCASCFI
ncbi:phosphoadenosine phosphosulfate reductase family protein [Dyadobacter sp. CY261]|uniref:phosphoadenosine phosphosulfate reductase family protein n=1 Tax=Dyadobacter sp. CY261 TaxID=2907203 RepID=UPI001F42E7B2|nr:phosphoadenosine phosphosulfate reductase family protein [Dyadobacter sp. CY261]MCF0075599.1 phosphoadenosine phosphosulfate reductase family protein [Dyadobacter sp. CY261]